jgi:hypothetical protein|tara:strand:+ start:1354 stop:1533 length:180 start_codon:yes stop_codon:yes gene_type:complete
MTKYLIKLRRSWESTREVEVVAINEQEAIAIAESLEVGEDGWSDPEILEQYISDVEKVK